MLKCFVAFFTLFVYAREVKADQNIGEFLVSDKAFYFYYKKPDMDIPQRIFEEFNSNPKFQKLENLPIMVAICAEFVKNYPNSNIKFLRIEKNATNLTLLLHYHCQYAAESKSLGWLLDDLEKQFPKDVLNKLAILKTPMAQIVPREQYQYEMLALASVITANKKYIENIYLSIADFANKEDYTITLPKLMDALNKKRDIKPILAPYDRETSLKMLHTASGLMILWTLYRLHDFAKEVVDAKIKENPKSPLNNLILMSEKN